MKKLLFVILLLFSATAQAQEGTITYEEVQAGKRMSDFFNPYEAYVASDGQTYRVGDTITIGKATNDYQYATLNYGDGVTFIDSLPDHWIGTKLTIKKIMVAGTRNMGFWVRMRTSSNCWIMKFEQALELGEIIGLGMTEDEAIAELKKAKDLFDLGVISEDEYNAKRTELIQYIKH